MAYTATTVEGGLFPPDLLDRIANGQGAGQAATDFGFDSVRLSDEIQAVFSDVRAYWDGFQRRLLNSKESRATLTRSFWMVPLFERLGFEQLVAQRSSAGVDGEGFFISHRAGEDDAAPPVHIVGSDLKLGEKGGAKRSPHALVQEFLNRSDALWGMGTNGERLRLLRDSVRFSRPTYLEFDLRGIIEGNLYNEFVILYRMLHRSRFPTGASDASSCILERLYQEGLESGGRVRKHLRDGVEEAIEELGAAFLRHPDSDDLRQSLATARLSAAEYYRQLLRLIYRLLFLFVAEERRLIMPERTDQQSGAGDDRREIYSRYYSLARLRERCLRPAPSDRESDLWQGLLQTFLLFRDESAAAQLGLAALNGELFGGAACRELETAACENGPLLRALFHLATFWDGQVRRPVNYAALDVEELGSVYESLLDYQPAVDLTIEPPFRLVSGSDRKQTGSYYTPPELVHELIESALVPVITERLANAKTSQEKEKALLAIRVCDSASGSGHFLLAAARRLGRELARVRSGEAEPDPETYRRAVRDVIRTCIYAVDKNPLAVDLCKVALWIEGHHAGLPLSFLDHHVKCGDSLVGVFDLKVLREGIPDEAYKPVTGDDKKAAAHIKKLNQTLRKRSEENAQQRLLVTRADSLPVDPAAALAREMQSFAEIDEQSPSDVQAKQELYASLHGENGTWWTFGKACDLWTAAFFLPLAFDDSAPSGVLVPTSEDVERALSQPKSLHGKLVGAAEAAALRLGFFHWPLEFPEVFASGGFDVVLGNPPFVNAFRGDIDLRQKNYLKHLDLGLSATADLGAYFLSAFSRLLKPNGRIGMIEPRTFLNSESAARFREWATEFLPPVILFAPDRSDLFEGPAVFVSLIVLGSSRNFRTSVSTDLGNIEWFSGVLESSNWWKAMQETISGDVLETIGEGTTLSSTFEVAESMATGDAYDVKPFVFDLAEGHLPKLVTTGLIDPGLCLWGVRRCRYLKSDYSFPRVTNSPDLTKSLLRRVERSRRPKILVAGLSARLECFLDETGEFIGAKSTYSVFHPLDDVQELRQVCAQLLSDDATARFRQELGGNAMQGANITMTKSWLCAFRIRPPRP